MKPDITVRSLTVSEIHPEMLVSFKHHQLISQKWIKDGSEWKLAPAHDLRNWDDEKRKWVIRYMCEQIERGGAVFGVFSGNNMVGFCCVDGLLRGTTSIYANLTMLFVDDNYQHHGIGTRLFASACDHAWHLGAHKLFISAIPAYETIFFYQTMGCTDAAEIVSDFVDTPNDRYLEYDLKM